MDIRQRYNPHNKSILDADSRKASLSFSRPIKPEAFERVPETFDGKRIDQKNSIFSSVASSNQNLPKIKG
jgi:hypothetical protein